LVLESLRAVCHKTTKLRISDNKFGVPSGQAVVNGAEGVSALRASIPDALYSTPRRGQSVPRPAPTGGAMLTLLRLPS
jgi:hypothetical protein